MSQGWKSFITASFSLPSTGSAIKCYTCNSHLEPDCLKLETPKAKDFLTDCGDEADGHRFTLCRKIEMAMDMDFGVAHPSETRVHRACGWEENDEDGKECYYKSGYNTRSWVCACKDDGCNSASLPAATFVVLPLAALTLVLRGVY
ncbi:uncharacterized protein LOC125048382 [Penaeus chinensis]|uniref:uncharacterized protein LOC125048382 n=1 Tax=Penaeus chinensis TaxID=139456 RepID=UPI001FB853D8|nr:uncharacterized protein LOC125048382 [Penaeus chinensis]